MGVYTTVHVCIDRGGGPLDDATRRAIVERCVEAELFGGACVLTLPKAPSLGPIESLRHRMTGWWPFQELGERGIRSFPTAPGPASREFERRWEGSGAVAVEAVADLPSGTPFLLTAETARWRDEPIDGVAYVALLDPVSVQTFDAYAAERHPFARPDVGAFHDVLTLTSRGAVDGRSLASSGLVRGLKKDLGLKVTCRSSHH